MGCIGKAGADTNATKCKVAATDMLSAVLMANWMCHTLPCCRPAAAKTESSGQKDTSPDLRRCYQTQQMLRPCSSCLVSSYKHSHVFHKESDLPCSVGCPSIAKSMLLCLSGFARQAQQTCKELPTICLRIAQPALVHDHSALHATSQNGVINKTSRKCILQHTHAYMHKSNAAGDAIYTTSSPIGSA